MRRIISAISGLLLMGATAHTGRAIEMTWEFSVQVSAVAQTSPPQLTLSWPQDQYMLPNSYTVYRKAPGDSSWGQGTTLSGTATSYVDHNVVAGTTYEYQVVKATSQYTSYGYVYSGITVPMIDYRGKLLLVVDNTFAADLASELARLQQDLVGDGWTVVRIDVGRNDSVASVKSKIKAQYNADPTNVDCVFLFGHVPVPYSGNIVPDGHAADHQGAWPCDGFYGDMDGVWTDNSVNITGQYDPRNTNVPGDGKFDQSSFPAPIKLMVGRVDLANMPGEIWYGGPTTFPSELDLLRNYLNKDHKFRTWQFDLPRRAIMGDFFGVRNGEAFAASGWRNFASFFGAGNTTMITNNGAWLNTLKTTPYLWAYGCGAGSFTSISGLGNSGAYSDMLTRDVYTNDLQAVFTLFFGSWLGDFDAKDNILRSVLATPSYGLTCAWSGRPHWFMQHMALGLPIGYSARLTQNNGPNGLYQNEVNSAAGLVHVALMGDPTLRMHVVAPPSNVVATTNSSSITLNWSPSTDSVLGYHVYRLAATNGNFTRLTSTPISTTAYTDNTGTVAANYMVRAVKLETSGSGTYYNPSEAAFASPLGSSPGGISGDPTGTTNSTPPIVGGTTNVNPTGVISNTPSNVVVWVDDSLPPGANAGIGGRDAWNWVSSNPSPVSGNAANQSTISAGLHQHFFSSAAQSLTVNAGDLLFAYVYIDPNNPPSEIMLQWNNGSWEHRAFWGADNIGYGTSGTASRSYMGALPASGQWVLLQVPASRVGLEGTSVNGMAFSQFDGRATWDYSGKAGNISTNSPPPNNGTNSTGTGGAPVITVWVDDNLPADSLPGVDGDDAWNWVTSNPTALSGSVANQSTVASGLHQHFFSSATQTLAINKGDVLFAYVYLDPINLPSEIMLQWNDGSWDHRAYWGADKIAYGTPGTTSLAYMGPLPAAGKWTLLQVPASAVGLEDSTINGMAFSQYDGRVTWDYCGKTTSLITSPAPPNNGGTNTTGGVNTNAAGITLANPTSWVDDALPTGAVAGTDGGDAWNWVSSNPSPLSGNAANQSTVAAGLHQHFFTSAARTLAVNNGDLLFAYVFIDPNNPPSEIMLQWNDGDWEHRAFWGADHINYGIAGTTSRAYMGPLPAAGQWVLLQVRASQVGLESSTVSGMAFSQYYGRATWDYAGKATGLITNAPSITSGGINGVPPGDTNSVPTTGGANSILLDGTNNLPATKSNTPPIVFTNTIPAATNTLPGVSLIDYLTPQLPKVGDNVLHILTPTLLELKLITTKEPDSTQVTQWNFINSSGQFTPPAASAFSVTANGKSIGMTSVGFKRRPLYAPIAGYDLRIDNSIYLQLASPISDNQSIEVKNTDSSLWSSTTKFVAAVDPLRYSPAIHVNQEGYMPNYTKKAMVGYYAGSMGEISIPASAGFKIVDATTGAQVYQGNLVQRPDFGYTYSPTPYQQVYEADFTAFNTPGEYRLVVPGMGGSVPFMVHDGVAMSFARAYALGLYHQRCGTNTTMPYTRFTHNICHAAPAAVPVSSNTYPFTWSTIAGYANTPNPENPTQIAPALVSPAAQLFPYINQASFDVSGGHHDAGDYSKYTINSASLVHYLMFAVDSLNGVAALDNLGIPESGDGISDVMQEAKWEADFLAKLQDSDGGFYFLVYPQNREYEGNVTPDHGDPQVVWPKTTSVTAASVAALAQCATSPLFKKTYPAVAATYLQKAKLGWQFLMNAINAYGKNGAYQKITHYGDNFADNDELAWAACQMYLATGDASIHQLLLSWFDPSDPATWRWGEWHMSECYGHAMRSYAFAVSSGRATASQLDSAFLGKCQAQIAAAADDMLSFSQQNAYGTSFPKDAKSIQSAGWYFSCDQAFDLAVAYQLSAKPDYLNAILANMNYEGGCNPINVCYVTGLGWKRTRDIVSEWGVNDTRVLPPSGIPVGNIQGSFGYLWDYGAALRDLCFPSDGATSAPYPFYDRWGDSWNVTTEMVILNQGRSLGTLGFLAAQSAYKTQAWKAPANGHILVPSGVVPVGSPVQVTLQIPGLDLSGARVTWEARNQEPAYGLTFTFTPQVNGAQWVEAEAQWPDGRRAFAKASFMANSPNIIWVDDAIPNGATAAASGGDSWNWITSGPAPFSGTQAHQSANVPGEHQHYFSGATATLSIGTGDVLYAYVYLDPANTPSELMLQWNDGTWEHRAYWGSDNLGYGVDGTPSRVYMGPLPAAGQWVQLKVPASKVNLEGSTLNGMGFTLYNGRAVWDAAGRLSNNFSGAVSVPASLRLANTGATISWNSTSAKSYQIAYKNNLNDAMWTTAAQVTATGSASSWIDPDPPKLNQRFYLVAQTN